MPFIIVVYTCIIAWSRCSKGQRTDRSQRRRLQLRLIQPPLQLFSSCIVSGLTPNCPYLYRARGLHFALLFSSPGTPFDSALCGYRLFRTSRLVVQTAGSIVLALRVYFDLEIICSTIFDSWLRNWEWHKEKKHRHPHLNLNLLLPKPVDA
jgi:hypothetical protein